MLLDATEPAPASPEEVAGLERIRSRRRLMWITTAATPLILGLGLLAPDAVAVPIDLIVVSAVFAAAFAHYRCRCPRCGELFNVSRGRKRHATVSECGHCGLPLRARP